MPSANNIPNHTVENANMIYDLVLLRLPFLQDTPANAKICSILTYEILNQLNPCFQVDSLDSLVTPPTAIIPPVPANVGNEAFYTFGMKSPAADILACYILLIQAGANITGTSTAETVAVPPSPTFLAQTKAGSVEVKWGQFEVKQALGLFTNFDTLYKQFANNAKTKMFGFGCILDIYEDCTMAVEIIRSGIFKPFITLNGRGCCD